MARLARIVLTGTRVDDELDPITVDLFLDDSRHVVHKFPTCGWWGKLKGTDDLMPFILFPDGKMDFGTGFDEDDRYHRTNLQSKRLEVGEYVTVTHEFGEHCFAVKQVVWADELG
jgi:hypothetical protein